MVACPNTYMAANTTPYNPDVVSTLQTAVKDRWNIRLPIFAKQVNARPAAMLRDLMSLKKPINPASRRQSRG